MGNDPVFIAGCSECATLCHAGGEKEVLAMKKVLKNKNKKVVGSVILNPACHLLNDKRLLWIHKKEIENALSFLSLMKD